MHAHRRAALAAAAAIGLWSTMVPAWADGMPRSSRPDPYAYTPGGIALDYDWTGIYLGGHAGGAISDWNWNAANPFVVGAEVSYTWADLKGSKPSELVVGTSLTSEANNLLLVTARLGFAWQHVLAYVKGGYASVDVAFSSLGASASKRADGSVAGLGLEFGLTPHITIGAEYDWLKVNAAAPGALDAGVDIQTLTARLNFKFGPRAGAVAYK